MMKMLIMLISPSPTEMIGTRTGEGPAAAEVGEAAEAEAEAEAEMEGAWMTTALAKGLAHCCRHADLRLAIHRQV